MALREKDLVEGEHIVRDLRTHWKVLAKPAAMFVVVLAVFGVAWWFARGTDRENWVLIGVGAIAVVLTAIFVVIPIWRWNTTRYTITNRRVSHRYGILTKRGRDIPLYRINDIGVERHLLDRMLGCGTLIISDATAKAGLELHDVPSVERVQVELQELLYQADDGSDDGEFPPTEPERPRGR